MALKVLMMGGRRCGKTSALASLFDQSINGEVNNHFTIADTTTIQVRDGEKIDMLSNKRLELINSIEKGGNNTFLVDQAPTNKYWDYTLKVQIPGNTRKYLEMVFRDSAGEFFEVGNQYHNDTIAFIQECDVFVIVVDTPYMMEGTNAEKEAANVTDSIHTFLTHMDTSKAKQVIFVPVKCEKWVKEGKIDKVTDTVKKLYAATFNALMAINNIEVSIIPIETAGDIIFEELREPYILYNNITGKQQKCSKTSEKSVVLYNGNNYRLTANDILNEDLEGIFPGTNITRPAAWYSLRHEPKAKYTPHNCEQLSLHILRFMFNKQKNETYGGFIGWLLKSFFGTITMEEMENALIELRMANLIKDSGEGITILKSCYLGINADK